MSLESKRAIFIAAFSAVFIIMIIDILGNAYFVKDCLFVLATIGLFYFLERTHPLPPSVIIIGLVPMILHIVGVSFGLFSLFIFKIGFDKYVHLISAGCLTIVAFYWLIANSHKHYVKKAFVALIIAQGFGALNEVNEFVGTHYLHIYGSTMFAQGDELPTIVSDLQVYDTWWDMIFNLGGALIAVIILISLTWHKHRKKKKKKP